MDAHSNPRRALKSVQEQEDRRLRKRTERDRARRIAQTASERQALPHSREVSMNVKEWQLKALRRKITAEKYLREHERMAAETSQERKKITVEEHQPARIVGG